MRHRQTDRHTDTQTHTHTAYLRKSVPGHAWLRVPGADFTRIKELCASGSSKEEQNVDGVGLNRGVCILDTPHGKLNPADAVAVVAERRQHTRASGSRNHNDFHATRKAFVSLAMKAMSMAGLICGVKRAMSTTSKRFWSCRTNKGKPDESLLVVKLRLSATFTRP